MRGIEAMAQAEPDVEISVLQQNAGEGESRQGGDLVGELKLEIKERLRVDHAVTECSGTHCCRAGQTPAADRVGWPPPARAATLARRSARPIQPRAEPPPGSALRPPHALSRSRPPPRPRSRPARR